MSDYSKKELTHLIKKKATELGFDKCGFAKTVHLDDQEQKLNNWLKDTKHDEWFYYIKKKLEIRLDPSNLVENAKSLISLLINYFPQTEQRSRYKIAKYAYGQDYHKVIKNKLKQLGTYIISLSPGSEYRAFVDTGPILEKAWAVRCGLGQIGKNTLLITESSGSFFFLGEIITNIELEYDTFEFKDICADCTKCLNACPTNALKAPFSLEASKCLSAITIERKGKTPDIYKGKLHNRIYGCDICQDVCPYNKNAKPHKEPLFDPIPEIVAFDDTDWEKISEEEFKRIFDKSSIKRTGFPKFHSNIMLNK